MLQIAGRLLDRTGDLRGLGGEAPRRAAPRRTTPKAAAGSIPVSSTNPSLPLREGSAPGGRTGDQGISFRNWQNFCSRAAGM